ncbi:GNAT family N-acetyltransferase [Yinghuangia soli]|uniref:GNAT family N-acetyltransferase n=1 Tax=Yinghuangia soli TaxID=2908204 RepID=UPI0027E31DB8|nr:GNAT family N-acetyltransferase [Yinghuangia soli]
MLLDILDVDDAAEGVDRVGVAAALYDVAAKAVLGDGAPVGYVRFVEPGWRAEPAVRRGVEERMAVLERAGARLMVERLRLDWTPEAGTREPDGRLEFRAVRDDAELIGMMTEVLDGTLDAHSLADLETMTAREAAEAQFRDEFAAYTTPREWWRVATLPGSGEPVGFVVAARNSYNPILAYIGVLPAFRGRGYVDEVVAEGVRVLAAQDDVPRIRASTDLGNVPMAAAFERAGFRAFEHALHMAWE